VLVAYIERYQWNLIVRPARLNYLSALIVLLQDVILQKRDKGIDQPQQDDLMMRSTLDFWDHVVSEETCGQMTCYQQFLISLSLTRCPKPNQCTAAKKLFLLCSSWGHVDIIIIIIIESS
jgi:hypothetical protein